MDLFFYILVSSIGLGYFIYGKKSANAHFLIFGIILMFYSYLTQDFLVSFLLGILFVIAPFITSKFF